MRDSAGEGHLPNPVAVIGVVKPRVGDAVGVDLNLEFFPEVTGIAVKAQK